MRRLQHKPRFVRADRWTIPEVAGRRKPRHDAVSLTADGAGAAGNAGPSLLSGSRRPRAVEPNEVSADLRPAGPSHPVFLRLLREPPAPRASGRPGRWRECPSVRRGGGARAPRSAPPSGAGALRLRPAATLPRSFSRLRSLTSWIGSLAPGRRGGPG